MPKFNEARKIATHLKKFEAEINSMVNTMGVMAKNHFTANLENKVLKMKLLFLGNLEKSVNVQVEVF